MPFARRSTSFFITEVFKKWTKADGLSEGIIKCEDSFVADNQFETNDVNNIDMTATNYQVQEAGTHIFEFTTTSQIPGTEVDPTIL